MLATGSTDGTVILWRLRIELWSNSKTIDKLIVYKLARGLDLEEILKTPKYKVQSVCIGNNKIIIGTQSGNIIESKISSDGKVIKAIHSDDIELKTWIECIDHERPKIYISIDMISSRIFSVTSSGTFSVWDVKTFKIIHYRIFDKAAQILYSFKLSNRVMIVFENDIIILNTDPLWNTFEEIP